MLLTFGSQAADMSVGSMTAAPPPQRAGRSWALWKRLAQGRPEFGNPDAFFGEAHVRDSRWVTFTITTTGTDFLDLMSALTGSETGRGGLVSLIDSRLAAVAVGFSPAGNHLASRPAHTSCGATAYIRKRTAVM